MSVKILGTGSFLPEKSVSNDDLSKVMDTSDEWISSRTGIRSRHISIEDTTSTMAVKAAEKALEDAGIRAEELDHIFVATLSGDYATPSTASVALENHPLLRDYLNVFLHMLKHLLVLHQILHR